MTQTNSDLVKRLAAPADVEPRVLAILCEQSDTDPATVDRETRLSDLGDSLDRVEAVMKLEEEFELAVPDEEVERLLTVGALVDYITARCGGGGSGTAAPSAGPAVAGNPPTTTTAPAGSNPGPDSVATP